MIKICCSKAAFKRLVIKLKSEQLAWLIRRHAVEMTHKSQASHIASVLSVADIIAVLYSGVANVDPAFPDNPNRDRVILSKGMQVPQFMPPWQKTVFLKRRNC